MKKILIILIILISASFALANHPADMGMHTGMSTGGGTGGSFPSDDAVLLENSDYLLLETGDKLLLE